VFKLLGKNAGSTRKGWYWYEKAAMWEREEVFLSFLLSLVFGKNVSYEEGK